MARPIKTQLKQGGKGCPELQLGGWLDDKRTYLWFGIDGHCVGSLGGIKLYRLAKAIVKQMEHANLEDDQP